MTSKPVGVPAALPSGAYTRPVLVDMDALTVRVIGEGGLDLGSYAFADLGERTALLVSLVEGFAIATGPAGRWRSAPSLRTGNSILRRFYRDMQARRWPVQRIEQVTPPVWASWRNDVLQTVRWPGQLNAARALLHDVPGLPDETRRAMQRRNPQTEATPGL